MSQAAVRPVPDPDRPTAPDTENPGYRYYALGLLTIAYMLNFVDRQILSVVQEPMREELGISDTWLGLLQGTLFAMFYVTAGIPIARWADIGNRRNIVAIAVGLWSLMTALQGLAQNVAQLALARFGVGVGEAGGSPPAHSMISDLFKPSERGRALALYSSGVTFGVMLAYVLGGWVSDNFGWRIVFVVVGLPGVILGLVIRWTLREPERGLLDASGSATAAAPAFMTVMKTLMTRRSFLLLSVAAGLHAFTAYGIGAFIVSFFYRSYGLASISEVTVPLGLMIGGAGALGNFLGGYLADRWGTDDKRWYVWVPAISTLLAIPFAYASFLSNSFYLAIALYFLPLIFGYMYLGPTLALTHGLVSPRMRAVASSILFFILNLIGLGLGPTATGLVSDLLRDGVQIGAGLQGSISTVFGSEIARMTVEGFGDESLRYAILIMFFAYFACAIFYFLAARYIREDLANAPT